MRLGMRWACATLESSRRGGDFEYRHSHNRGMEDGRRRWPIWSQVAVANERDHVETEATGLKHGRCRGKWSPLRRHAWRHAAGHVSMHVSRHAVVMRHIPVESSRRSGRSLRVLKRLQPTNRHGIGDADV